MSSDDEEKYVPAALANGEKKEVTPDVIEEFYKPDPAASTSRAPSTAKPPPPANPNLKQVPPQHPRIQHRPNPLMYPPSVLIRPTHPSMLYQRTPINYQLPFPVAGVPRAPMVQPYHNMRPSSMVPMWPGYLMMPVPHTYYPGMPHMLPVAVRQQPPLPQQPQPRVPPPLQRSLSPEINVDVISEISSQDEEKINVPFKKRRVIREGDLDGEQDEEPRKLELRRDIFVIRLKDLDSFNRNNEIWRVDNNVLIQKFTGVPSFRAPAKQFQSTNRMCGYDRRADWRFYIIDPNDVEYDRHSHEITVHKFPSAATLREAKLAAEKQDETFKDTEMTEYREKLLAMEKKKEERKTEKMRKKIERIQKRLERNRLKVDRNGNSEDFKTGRGRRKMAEYKWPKRLIDKNQEQQTDDEVCQEVLDLLVDEVSMMIDEYESEESEYSYDEDEEDFDGYRCTDDEYYEQKDEHLHLPLFDLESVPEVGLEMTITSSSPVYR